MAGTVQSNQDASTSPNGIHICPDVISDAARYWQIADTFALDGKNIDAEVTQLVTKLFVGDLESHLGSAERQDGAEHQGATSFGLGAERRF